MSKVEPRAEGIAIIGMAGRFPKARNVDEFWRNLRDGVESISFFTDEELAAAGVEVPKSNPSYVRARAILDDADKFDTGFFGINPKEAEVMDPQHRVFLECAWEALESAGYDSEKYDGLIGVFAGMSMNTYLASNLASHPEIIGLVGDYQVMLGNDKDFLPTRVSYKLNLKGPSLNIQTACSTSLVAVCVACQHLLNYQCDMALAGAVSLSFPQKKGYFYQEGGIASPDGHCRAFDAKAGGTIAGEGVGIVVLKRLQDALADGDPIHAVIKGFAINNDGSQKIGYTAPSVEGQAEVIAMAQAVAGVEPETISYVEAHGTGTPLGDPIEIEGLTKAFRANTPKKNFCAVGSVKSNIGHLDTAAGVAGLIKTTLALQHQTLPPSLHFASPNPKIDFANSPFYVNAKRLEWKPGQTPRRAGVSSFGIGGTNAHIVLEEAPAVEPSGRSRPAQLLLLSARTSPALDQATANLVEHLKLNPELNLADVAYTLQVGRREFAHRRMLVCRDVTDAVKASESQDARRIITSVQENENPPVVFMFPGQGAQHVNMGRELYEHEPVFREHVDSCCAILKPHLGLDLRAVLYPTAQQTEEAKQQLTQTFLTQPLLFVVEYALAKLWMSWGVHPEAMIGHSIGEYVAACLGGVFSLEDALVLIAARGRLMQQLSAGSMLAVRLPAEEIRPLLNGQLSLAAVNGASLCVVSGPVDAVQMVQEQFTQRNVACRLLPTSHAFHSAMVEPILKPFAELLKGVKRNAPRIPYMSNVSGTWITPEQATDPGYWTTHLRQTVRFAHGLTELFTKPERIFLEVGPGQTLTTLARQHPSKSTKSLVVSSLPHAQGQASSLEFLLNGLGQLWLAGAPVDWWAFSNFERRHRLRLPTYPFERKRYWVEPAMRDLHQPISAARSETPPTAELSQSETAQQKLSSVAAPALIPEPSLDRTTPATRKNQIAATLKSLLSDLSGLNLAQLNGTTTFVESGFDSLFLAQATQAIEKKLGVKVAFRQLLNEFSTLDALAAHIDSVLPPTSRPAAIPTTIAANQPSLDGTPQDVITVPLTEAQKEIWFASQMNDGASCAYNESRLLHLEGELQPAAMRRAVQRLVDRHEALRTAFSPSGDCQRILSRLKLDIPLVDLSKREPGQREAQLATLESEEAGQPFDFVEGPLLRARLVRLAPDHHVLFLTIHHIVCDGRAWAILLRELGEIYSAERRDSRCELALPLQLSAYAREQARREQSPERAAAEAYWVKQFAGDAPILELPVDLPRPSVWTFHGARENNSIGKALCRDLKRVSAQHGCTLFQTLLAGYYLLLHRLTSQEEIVVGIPTADRVIDGSDTLVGHCINFLPVRGRIANNPIFTEFLSAVKGTFLEAYDHQHFTFGSLVQKLSLPRDPSRMPLVNVTFNVERMRETLKLSGLETRIELNRTSFSNFDLSFNITEMEGMLHLDCRYNRSLFSSQTIRRWLGHFQTLLEGIIADPSQRIGELPLLTESERQQVLVEWNDTRPKYPRDKTLPQLFEEHVEKTPDAVAVVCEEERLTYRELNQRANQLAHHLRSLGVGPEVLVGIFMERSIELAVGLLGILKAGGAYLPLDPVYPKDRLAFMLEDGQASVLLTQQRLRDSLPPLAAKVICLDADWGRIARARNQNPAAGVGAENLAYVIYTSGSTGKPKGSLVTHYNVVRLLQATEPWFHFNDRDVWTLFHSPAFDFSVWEYWGALLYGGRVVMVPYLVSRSPETLYELLVKERVTVLNQTPSAFRQLMAAEEAVGVSPKLALRLVIFGGEALELQSLKGWFARHGDERPQLVNMYGITETTVHVTYRPLRATDVNGGSVIGVPIPDLQVYVLDPYGQPAPVGVPGEMYVGGAGLARGYLNRPDLTAERFIPNPFSTEPGARLYRTGDLARLLPGRDIEYLGRIDHQVKIRGFRIELGEIESLINQHPAVRECVVIAPTDATGGKQLVAYCVPHSRATLQAEELRRHLRQKLPDYMMPAAFVSLESLPLTPHGKVDRKALPAPERTRSDQDTTFAASGTPTEEALAKIWREVLHLECVGVHDNFFELGGHSLLMTQVISRVREAFQVELPIRRFFETPTIGALAVAIEEMLIEEITELSDEEVRRSVASAP